MALKHCLCNFLLLFMMKKHRYRFYSWTQGFSLLEALIALTLLSTVSIVLIRFQMRMIGHVNNQATVYAISSLQSSFAESMQGCQKNFRCQSYELQKWQRIFKEKFPFAIHHVYQDSNTFLSVVILSRSTQKIELKFTV